MTQIRVTAVAARSAPRHASPSRRTRRWSSWPPATCAPRPWSSRSRRWHPTRPARCARSQRMPAPSAAGRSRASATAAGGRRSSAACTQGSFEDEVVVGLADILRAAGVAVAWVTTVPSASLGDVIVRLGERLAAELGVPHAGARLAHRRSPAPARDGQRHAAGRQRPRRVRGHRHTTAGHRGPARRSSPLGLDNGDGRRPATPSRRPPRHTTRTRDADLGTSRTTPANHPA